MPKFFTIEHLTFSFDEESQQPFFENVQCSFRKNAMNFIRGKNGAGKSTLFRILRGNAEAHEALSGFIQFAGKKYDLSSKTQRQRFGQLVRLSPQKFDELLADQFNFMENLQLSRLPRYPGLSSFQATTQVPSIVQRFEINYTTPVGMLSGGQRQILAILMALQHASPVLLLDEPTAALDAKNTQMVMAFLQELLHENPELTILIICHDREVVETYANQEYAEITVHENGVRTIENIIVSPSRGQ